nr:hypothetical protein [Tanacetum cinerariifolium]
LGDCNAEDDGEILGEGASGSMVVDEGVPVKLTETYTAGAGETSLSTRGGSRITKSTKDSEKGTGFGTRPELICPGVRKLGAGPVLRCTGAIGSVSPSN